MVSIPQVGDNLVALSDNHDSNVSVTHELSRQLPDSWSFSLLLPRSIDTYDYLLYRKWSQKQRIRRHMRRLSEGMTKSVKDFLKAKEQLMFSEHLN